MKKFLILLAVLMLGFTACGDDEDGPKTTLTIANMSSYNIIDIEYSSVNFSSMPVGSRMTREVSPGINYVFLSIRTTTGKVRYRTVDLIDANEGIDKEFVIVNSSFIIPVAGGSANSLQNICDELDLSDVLFEIGDAGPGDGIIFFVSGGQYMECSPELGNYDWRDATRVGRNHRGGGFTDWRLADRESLDLMYKNLHGNGLGGFSNSNYWSLAEVNTTNAWAMGFADGSLISISKTNAYSVRAVRSFNF